MYQGMSKLKENKVCDALLAASATTTRTQAKRSQPHERLVAMPYERPTCTLPRVHLAGYEIAFFPF